VNGDEPFVGYTFRGSPPRQARLWFLDRQIGMLLDIERWTIDDICTWTCSARPRTPIEVRCEHDGDDPWVAVWRLTQTKIDHAQTFGDDSDTWRLGVWPDSAATTAPIPENGRHGARHAHYQYGECPRSWKSSRNPIIPGPVARVICDRCGRKVGISRHGWMYRHENRLSKRFRAVKACRHCHQPVICFQLASGDEWQHLPAGWPRPVDHETHRKCPNGRTFAEPDWLIRVITPAAGCGW